SVTFALGTLVHQTSRHATGQFHALWVHLPAHRLVHGTYSLPQDIRHQHSDNLVLNSRDRIDVFLRLRGHRYALLPPNRFGSLAKSGAAVYVKNIHLSRETA